MDERENLTKINNDDIERQVSVCSKLGTLGCAFKRATTSIGGAFEPTRAFVEESGISKVAFGIGNPIKTGSVDGLFKPMFAADSSFMAPGRSLVSAFESTRALSEASGISKAMGGIGDLLGKSTLGAAIEAVLPLQKNQDLNPNKLFDFPDYRSSVIAQSEPVIVQHPPREVFREEEILKEIIIPEYDREIPDEYEVPVVPEEIFLEDRLRDIDRGLPNLLQGARHALSTDNPDRARHVTVSLRELTGHVLRHLAPDNSIRSWTDESSYFHNHRPTRRARLLYINRAINNGSLSEFIDADVTSTIKLMDLLNGRTHDITSHMTDRELQALVTRTELLLLSWLHLYSQ